ncbi:hypothetical protein HMPREF3160_07710 [Arthrobacter sp. HMSC06H05]|uniref:DUF3153 domain-containing protein n=1 Tax=Pseudoglutamicibacter albus TaxID=98671 RepID=A0ABU1YY02_9MICC|nr:MULTISPECIES: hypothetical protein [Micrococcaceae]MDR7293239.1 hypothetical protein [Pseudoglutamicibacter albus]OFT41509.1 hypothetical protein HMPREF3160_07710 [Arthrobacter sp. HMSC06H05]
MKFTKSFRAMTAALFAGAMVLTGCSAGGDGASNAKPEVNKFTYDVELEADVRTPEKLEGNVDVQLELTEKMLQEQRKAGGDDKFSAKAQLEGVKQVLASRVGIDEKKLKVVEKSEQDAHLIAEDLTMQEVTDLVAVQAEYTSDGTYLAQVYPMVIAGNQQQGTVAELNLTLPAAITEANTGGQISGNTATWTTENLEEAVKANEAPEFLTAETRPATTVDQTPIWLSVVIFVLGVIAAALMVALAVIPSKKTSKSSNTAKPNTAGTDAAEGNA